MKKPSVKKLALCGVLTAFALIAFMLENLLPPLFLPGARLGLSNIFILICAYLCGGIYGFCALIIKCVVGSIFSGNFSAIIYSLPSGLASLSLQLVLTLVVKQVSIVCSSIAGATVNITIQNLIFCLISGASEYLCYLPYLALLGVLSGLIVGFIVYLAIKKLPITRLMIN